MPAAGWHDFYLQTYRPYAAYQALAAAEAPAQVRDSDVQPVLFTPRAVAETAGRNPFGLLAYVCARLVPLLIHRVAPAGFSDTWIVSASTKTEGPEEEH